ncbi:Thrombomodulin [Larimichthys crocea]|uniref:Thrombomodulin n=1 Tax=Larimichthys crocea TaxID=215358 RepID=A0A6G0I6J1_LARCR|nr:thrombomodulin-like [Larimichthys crocea]KAE8287099.1 Thrombomodulin [Larimichthys crocea]
MKDVTRLFVVLLTFLMGRAGGMEPDSGYCIGNQCFTVYQAHHDYMSAQNQCGDDRGHLMTVRSTVARDVLSILLGNSVGRFWIGLHRTSGCPDDATPLKGFQWVTKDTESDYTNWAPGFDSSCFSHRCVSVSKVDDFKWSQEPCDEQAAGFLCEHTFTQMCKSLDAEVGETVTYTTPLRFAGEDLLSLPPGSTAIRVPGETKYVCVEKQWLQAPWNCEIFEGGCEYKCAEDSNHAPSCYCPAGQTVNPANKVTCEVIPDDPCVSLRCAHACVQKGVSYECFCDHGFQLAQDGRSCVDFNDCTDKRLCPGENFMCLNTVGGFECVCKGGFRLIDGKCVDVDECVSAPCEHICENSPGSYTCSCYDGYKEDPESPNNCKLHCGKTECVAECDPNDRYQCFCPDGYVSEEREHETVCIDIDECSSNYCDQDCKNTFGSYVCSCSPGYTLVNQDKCEKIDDDSDGDGGSGATTTSTTPYDTPPVPNPGPTRKPSAVTVGAFVGIIVCTVFFVVLVVFLVHHLLCSRGKMESAAALKVTEEEAHGLHNVKSDT